MLALNCFVRSSLAEGISNTMREAAASGLPVPASDVDSMAAGLVQMARHPEQSESIGCAGRPQAEQALSLPALVAAYQGLYETVCWRVAPHITRTFNGTEPMCGITGHFDTCGTLLFGSELKSLLVYEGGAGSRLRRDIDPLALEEYFALGNPSSVEDACVELVTRLRESVRLRMIAEVPLGAFLSGGVDSSAVMQAMADLSAEPYADSSVIPTYRVCQLARKHVTVALSGDGGDETFGGYSAQQVFDGHAARAGTDDPLALIQYLDLKTYLVGDINTKVDRASMAHSLEVREPLMDHKLIEWLATLPSSMKVRGSEGKFLLKKAMEPRLPNDVLYRPKMGFSVPLARWFRGPLKQRVRDAVLGDRLASTGWFNRDYLQHLVDAHQSGASDYSSPLWSLLMFDAFLRSVVDDEPGAAAAQPSEAEALA